MNKFNHPYHLVTISPWPLLMSISLMIMLIGSIQWFFELSIKMFIWGMMLMYLCSYQWWRDVIRESTFQGCHTLKVMNLIKWGMTLFILSEMFFFLSFFWTYFHMALSPSIEIGSLWPPMYIKLFNPYNIPLLNTITLLTSGITITWTHYMILSQNYKESIMTLSMTILLGYYFTYLQYTEYKEASFTITDSSFGSSFFLITGFHGLHVMIGTMFISIMLYRLYKYQFSTYHHLGFEFSAWYWHFVDVIWLFVYIFLYWWSF